MNKQIKLAKRVVGLPGADTWSMEESAIPTITEGQVLIKNKYISLDPAMRGWMNDSKSYLPPVGLGEVMRAGSVGEVIESKHPDFKAGEHLLGTGGVQQYVATDGKGWFGVDHNLAPLPMYLSVLGMTGMTAYFGLLDVGKPKAGETLLVSGAAGAVGSVVGQIGKIKGCRVVGIAGGPEKCAYIKNDLGFDEALDYKNDHLRKSMAQACPDGIDIYFDNVGGDILDLALAKLNRNARVVLCGGISQYNATSKIKGPSNYLSLLVNRARMEGFIVFDYASEYAKAGKDFGMWLMEGKLKSKEHIVEGIENFHKTFLRLFSGDKKGKLILKVD